MTGLFAAPAPAAAAFVPAMARDPEMQVLLCVARSRLGVSERERLRGLLTGSVDWARLFRLGERHRLLPLLHWHLRGFEAEVPGDARAALDAHFRSNAYRVLLLTRELLGLLGELESRNVPCLPYKGPVLAMEAYGNLALRSAGDLDVVVRGRDLPVVREVLKARGFVPEHQLSEAGKTLMERSLYHEVFLRDGCVIEVHWRFTDKHAGFSLDLVALEPRLRRVTVGGGEVRSLSREDLLLVLCVHGAKHMWDTVEGIAAVAELLGSEAGLDWPAVMGRASDLGSRRILFLGLRMARDVLGATAPAEIEHLAAKDPVVAELAAIARQQLFAATAEERRKVTRATKDTFYLKLNERPRDRLRYLLHRLVTPSQASSWEGFQVGRIYLPVHALLRPLRALRQGASVLINGRSS